MNLDSRIPVWEKQPRLSSRAELDSGDSVQSKPQSKPWLASSRRPAFTSGPRDLARTAAPVVMSNAARTERSHRNYY